VDACDRIARDQEKKRNSSLGWVKKVEYTQKYSAFHVGEIGGQIVGFVLFHTAVKGDDVGYTVVKALAVDLRYEGLGIGRNLLYSVECPIRLRCPQRINVSEPNPANPFYANAGLRMTGTETVYRGGDRKGDTRPNPLNVWELPILPILVQGNNRQMPDVARRSGWAYGVRATEKPRDYCLQVDIEWRDYSWTEYVRKIEAWKPFAALVPDYEHPRQRRTMLNRIEHLKALGVMRVLVCPKFDGAVADIPADCVVAVSIPSSYAGFVPDYRELRGRRVHLLGGTPSAWVGGTRDTKTGYIAGITGAGAKVISADGNSHFMMAQEFGKFRHGNEWVKDRRTMDIYQMTVRSGRAILADLHQVSGQSQLSLFAA
jgi:GNAT superfamily N-acetyltransferase